MNNTKTPNTGTRGNTNKPNNNNKNTGNNINVTKPNNTGAGNTTTKPNNTGNSKNTMTNNELLKLLENTNNNKAAGNNTKTPSNNTKGGENKGNGNNTKVGENKGNGNGNGNNNKGGENKGNGNNNNNKSFFEKGLDTVSDTISDVKDTIADTLTSPKKSNENKKNNSDGIIDMILPSPVSTNTSKNQTEKSSDSIISLIIKVVIMIVVLVVLYYVAKYLITKLTTVQFSTPYLLDGTKNGKYALVISQDPSNVNYIPITKSDGQDGIQFTYSFWFNLTSFEYKKGEWKHMFHKGNSTAYPNRAPGVWVHPDKNALRVYMNTVENILEYVDIDNVPMRKWVYMNIILNNKNLDIYVNGFLKVRKTLSSLPKQNDDDFWISMFGGFEGFISRIKYYPYAINFNEIMTNINSGPSKNNCIDTGEVPPYLDNNWWFNFNGSQ